ncbi:MAG: ribosome small subunit-dependent GTPase A [Lachnospira sp.]|nr:ribosome small subunit-dependent GTPase A [Lachnospira sp.]
MSSNLGKIMKGIGGFYYVHIPGQGLYECKAKGNFRKQGIKPLVGDNVEIAILNSEEKLGNIVSILPRTKELSRPAVANVDQSLVIFAAAEPNPNYNLLDRFLLSMQQQEVPTIICFNKTDIVNESEVKQLEQTYERSGYKVCFISVREEKGLDEVKKLLVGKTTVLAGPSGVGKSSLLNYFVPDASMETGSVSEKIKRGRHTTRHSEIFYVGDNTYLFDTPGFSSLYVMNLNKEQIKDYFDEFLEYQEQCRFLGCMHIHEPDCAVKKALAEGKISRIRYDNYIQMVTEVEGQKKW